MNKLYYGDCLTVMREYLGLGSVDLIYLDPPFNSNRAYNAIYKDETGRPLPDQIDAFCDLWTVSEDTDRVIRTMPVLMRSAGIDDSVAEFWRLWMNALRGTNERLLAYLTYMVERLLQMKPILKPTGSIYLHCDTTASHYIKVMMDAVFGHENFRNEIIWKRRYGTFSQVHSSKKFGTSTDSILFYAKSPKSAFNPQYSFDDPEYQAYLDRTFRHTTEDGRKYRIDNLANPAPRPNLMYEYKGYKPPANGWAISLEKMKQWDEEGRLHYPNKRGGRIQRRRFLDEVKGSPVQNLWADVEMIASHSGERLGYATQKPVALLERIIKASSNEGDTVLDPFCGCATTLEAAHKLNRKWIGIDIAIHAVKRVAAIRLQDRLGLREDVDFTIEGVPVTLEGAKDLWTRDKYHFQKWAIEQVDGFATTKRTGDGGIDGRIYFASAGLDVKGKALESMAIEVKGGKHVNIADLRGLRGALERDEAKLAGLIIMEPLGHVKARNFRREMSAAGVWEGNEVARPYQRMQMLTVQDILDGKRFDVPGAVARGARQGVLISA